MFLVKNSGRALLISLAPLGFIHAVVLAIAIAGSLTRPPLIPFVAPDTAFMIYLGRVGIDGVLLFAGHLCLRHWSVASRWAYATMGGVAAAAGYAITLRNGWLLLLPLPTTVITAGVLPTIGGVMAGFLYNQFAGLARIESAPANDAALVDEPMAAAPARFDGPVRVRTSFAALGIAATMPAVLIAILAFGLSYLALPGTDSGPLSWHGQIFAIALPAQIFLTTLIVTAAPAAIVTLSSHCVARAFGCRSGLGYTIIGCGMGFVGGLIGGPLLPLTSVLYLLVPAALCGAIMGALYRRFAGLEPLPLPEPVIVHDQDTLVDADHPSRSGHTILING